MGQKTLVKPGTKVKLADYDPGYRGDLRKGDEASTVKLACDLEAMRALQEQLYAESKQALLIVLQAMDCGGKDSTVKHVFSGVNPQGCDVTPFKAPTHEELAHDYLWRIHGRVPARGKIAIFNRSHYEDVLVVRVEELVPEKMWRKRYDQINDFERMLHENGTRILKLFLHISPDEQKARLERRLERPDKHWKFDPEDLVKRAHWDLYVEAYEEVFARCSTDYAPWHIIPANRKWYRNLVAADIIVNVLREMDPQWPEAHFDPSEIVVE